jgi:hypothetical protein
VLAAVITIAQATPQPVECTNCSDGSAWVGILLAGVALVVSFYSLYITSLRYAKIVLRRVPNEREFHFTSWRGPFPVQRISTFGSRSRTPGRTEPR